VNPDEQSLYADMRAAVRADQERVRKRAEQKRPAPDPDPAPAPVAEEPTRAGGLRRLFGRRQTD